ncbi:MAG: hypothetical protein AABX82_06805, partial [Nanoarchaeota archaeon]
MGLEDFACFRESIHHCPYVPWNMNLDHLDEIDKKVKEVKEERKQQELHSYDPTVIRRLGEKYYVLLTLSSGY